MSKIDTIRNGADAWGGRVAFGNECGLVNNVRGTVRKAMYERKLDRNIEFDPQFKEERVVELGNPHDPDVIQEIREQFDDVIESDETSTVRSEVDGTVYSRSAKRFQDHVPIVSELLSQEVVERIERYYGAHFRVERINAWRNYHVPQSVRETTEAFSNYWHCDSGHTTDKFKVFINVNDVTAAHGPFHILRQSASKSLARSGLDRDELVDVSTIENMGYGDDIVKATGEPGTTLMCSTFHCFHRAGIPSEGNHRDLIQLVCVPSSEPLPEDWPTHTA